MNEVNGQNEIKGHERSHLFGYLNTHLQLYPANQIRARTLTKTQNLSCIASRKVCNLMWAFS